jgi:TetR/AcrR family transcriptional repressor of nem operon
MPRQPVHKERIRRSILFEAARALRVEGPEKLGVAAIMGQVGLTHGGFYAYFTSKDDFIAQAITEIFDERYRFFLSVTEGLPAGEAMSKFVDYYVVPRHRDVLEDSCAIPSLGSYIPRMSAVCQARYADGVERLELAITKLLKDLGREHPRDLATATLASMAGAIVLARSVAVRTSSDRLLSVSRVSIKRQLGLA